MKGERTHLSPLVGGRTEREGFEPSIEVDPLCRFSKPVPSATRPPLQLIPSEQLNPVLAQGGAPALKTLLQTLCRIGALNHRLVDRLGFPISRPAQAGRDPRRVLHEVRLWSVPGVAHRHGGGRVAEQLLEPGQEKARHDPVSGEGIPEIMHPNIVQLGRRAAAVESRAGRRRFLRKLADGAFELRVAIQRGDLAVLALALERSTQPASGRVNSVTLSSYCASPARVG